ncbi:MAG: glutamate racemase [Acidimicrobiia bacterium]|nr:glutamate racemase [Acidimicrobiia bacterium]
MTAADPIGVFDSGVGGISVLREIRRALPAEDLIYFADSGHAPYGDRPESFIGDRAAAVVDFLVRGGAKAIVVACNTVTGVAVETLRARFALPIVAMEPAVKPAAAMTKRGVIGVLATSRTLAGERFARLLSKHAAGVDVVLQSCAGLVEQVERGDFDGPETRRLVERFVSPLRDRGADVIVLGCTHYPFVSALIAEVAGPGVTIVDPAEAVARELTRRLRVEGLTRGGTAPGRERFVTSGSIEDVRILLGRLWEDGVQVEAGAA